MNHNFHTIESTGGLRLENVQRENRTHPPSQPKPYWVEGSNFEEIFLVAHHYGSSRQFLKFYLNAKLLGFFHLKGVALGKP